MGGISSGESRPPPVTGAGAGPDPGDEARLVARVRKGDREAFGELVARHMRAAYAVAYRLLRNREDSEDLVQESFLTALARLDQFDATRPFAPWLLRIVVNRGLNLRASRRVRQAEPLPEELPAAGAGPERAAERAELRARIERGLEGLSDRQRLVVELYEIDGFSGAEIAAMLDIAEPTVRWTLHEARKKLRSALAGWKEELDRG